jgi:hypothetical protein
MEASGAQHLQPGDYGLDVVPDDVDVHAVLAILGLVELWLGGTRQQCTTGGSRDS